MNLLLPAPGKFEKRSVLIVREIEIIPAVVGRAVEITLPVNYQKASPPFMKNLLSRFAADACLARFRIDAPPPSPE